MARRARGGVNKIAGRQRRQPYAQRFSGSGANRGEGAVRGDETTETRQAGAGAGAGAAWGCALFALRTGGRRPVVGGLCAGHVTRRTGGSSLSSARRRLAARVLVCWSDGGVRGRTAAVGFSPARCQPTDIRQTLGGR